MDLLRKLGSALQDILLPPRCHCCKKPVSGAEHLHICGDCLNGLPIIAPPVCSICGIPFEGVGGNHPCSRCIATPPPYGVARAALHYEGICRELIHSFKYSHRSQLRRPLGLLTAQLLSSFAAEQQPDLLMPVPLHPRRLRSRGFNQAVLVAEILAKQWQIPLARQLLQRTRPTTPQIELNREQRATNLQNAFAVIDKAAVSNRHIMLVDDIVTTGSTLSACAQALRDAGCDRVSAVTIAHAR